MDRISPEKRSVLMSRIRGKNTKPEMMLRSFLHKSGFRFRIHSKNLPGKPDIVLRKYNAVILVNGCFWHQHSGCKLAKTPKSRTEYWIGKLQRNVTRDREVECELKRLGWRVLIVWECELRKSNCELEKIANWIKSGEK